MPVTFSMVYAQFSPRDAMQTVRRSTLGVAYSLWNNVCREQLIRDFFQCLIVIRQGNGCCLMTHFGYLTRAIILILLLCNVVLCNQPLNVFGWLIDWRLSAEKMTSCSAGWCGVTVFVWLSDCLRDCWLSRQAEIFRHKMRVTMALWRWKSVQNGWFVVCHLFVMAFCQ